MTKKRLSLRNGATIIAVLAVVAGLTSCKKDDAKQITAFSFSSPPAVGIIDESAKSITVNVPVGTDVTALTPTIKVSDKATVSPASGVVQNFTNPVTYTVTAEDGSAITYKVTVTMGGSGGGGGGKNQIIIKNKVMSGYYSTVRLEMTGAGTVTIDWGDSTEVEINTLSDDRYLYSHSYETHTSGEIIITGNVTTLYLDYLITEIDASKNPALTKLVCRHGMIENINVSNNAALTHLECDNNNLESLDVSKCTALTYLDCEGNKLTELDLSKNIALTHLKCGLNKLTELDLSKNTTLTDLGCSSNKLASLDLSKNIALKDLYCSSNELTSLDLSKNAALTDLSCHSNKLASLDLSKNIALEYVCCDNNELTGSSLNALFETLHSNTISGGKKIYVGYPGYDDCDKTIAENRGWKVYAY